MGLKGCTSTRDAKRRFIKAVQRIQPRYSTETTPGRQLNPTFAPQDIKEPAATNIQHSIAKNASIMQSTENATTAISSYTQSQIRRQAISLITGAVAFASLAIIALLR